MSSSPKTTTTTTTQQPTHAVHKLLARIHPAETAALLFDKTRQKPLLLHPGIPGASTVGASLATGGNDKRSLRRHIRLRKKQYYLRKQKPQPLSAREKRELGVYKLDKRKGEHKYTVYEGLHRLWCGYMAEVLGLGASQQQQQQLIEGDKHSQNSGADKNQKQKQKKRAQPNQNQNKIITATSHGSLLASADFHGADVEVVRSHCVDRVGIRGIVVRDTKFTLVLVTRKDEVKIIPKRGAVFRYRIPVSVPNPLPPSTLRSEVNDLPTRDMDQIEEQEQKILIFELHGNQIEIRPPERATRKFKWKTMDYL